MKTRTERIESISERLRWFQENKYDLRFDKIRGDLLHLRTIFGPSGKTLTDQDITHVEAILSKIESICHPDDLFLFKNKDNWYKWG